MDFNLLTSLNDNIKIDRNKCTACGRCVEVCVLDNLRLQLSPCRQACPLGMNCQGYIHHLAQGKMDKGLEKVRETVPFGGILGRVCSRPCEAACNRIKVDRQPVARIRASWQVSDSPDCVCAATRTPRQRMIASSAFMCLRFVEISAK